MTITNRQRLLFLLFGTMCLWSCTFNYTASVSEQTLKDLKFKEQHRVTRSSRWILNSDTRLFLGAAEIFNSVQQDHVLSHTKDKMYLSFLNALSRAFPSIVSSSDNIWDVSTALVLAREANAQILIIPRLQMVVNTEDALSQYEASQIAASDQLYPLDTVVIRVLAYDVISGKLLDVANIDSRGRLFKTKHYSLSMFIDRAALSYSKALSGRALAPFG